MSSSAATKKNNSCINFSTGNVTDSNLESTSYFYWYCLLLALPSTLFFMAEHNKQARGSVGWSVASDMCRAERHGLETRPTLNLLPYTL